MLGLEESEVSVKANTKPSGTELRVEAAPDDDSCIGSCWKLE